MKVMCICKGNWTRNRVKNFNAPSYGEFLIVKNETRDGRAYNFEEYPHPNEPINGFAKRGFIECSDLDETIIHHIERLLQNI